MAKPETRTVSQKGCLKTIRFVIHPIEHGMEPTIFWGLLNKPRGRALSIKFSLKYTCLDSDG